MINGKGSVTLTLSQIAGVVLFIVLFIGVVFFIKDLVTSMQDTRTDRENFEKLMNAIDEVIEAEGSVAGKFHQLSLSQDTAIIAMNPGQGFSYEYYGKDLDGASPALYLWREGSSFTRPSSCTPTDTTCICLCENVDFNIPEELLSDGRREYREISCGELTCKRSEDFVLPQRVYLNKVFDVSDEEVGLQLDNNDNYWDNSWIIMRSSKVRPNSKISLTLGSGRDAYQREDRMIIAGYRELALTPTFDVFIYKAGYSGGKPIIGICFKRNIEECLPRQQDPYVGPGTI